MSKRKAIVACLAAAGTVVIGGTSGPASPVGAANVVGDAWVSGNFTGDARDEIFDYVGGTEPDYLVSLSNGGVPGDPLTISTTEFAVDGNLLPLAGDFDGDNRDEIFWYGPGAAADSMWHFQSTTSFVAVPYSVSGNYKPFVGDFTGDGADDIFWYAPGAAGDPLWDFNGSGAYTSVTRNVGGTYTPVVASIGKDNTDDVLWYGPGATGDSIWDFTRGTTNYTTTATNIAGVYNPIALDTFGDGWRGEDIYFHAPNGGPSPVWDYWTGQRFNGTDPNSPGAGTFDTVVGDYFADGEDDILWGPGANAFLWDNTWDGISNPVRWIYLNEAPASTESRVAQAEGSTATAIPLPQK